jgi:Type VI secretion system (T6SS), amidase effector protein 4
MSKFEILWGNFPDDKIVKSQCQNKQKDGSKPFGNYCAILLSDCFNKSGISVAKYKGKCWSHSGPKHILLAENLANGLRTSRPKGFGEMIKVTPASFQDELKNKTGVIFFKDYWQRGSQSFDNRDGDHIDLWNKNEISSSSMFVRSIAEFFRYSSDLNKSKEVWFWEVE